MDRVAWARNLAERLLAEPLPRRWSHVQGVGGKAESIAHIVGNDGETLICAAWLHDIGYAPSLVRTGLHSLDGARYLRDVEEADDGFCRLVANHSFAVIEAQKRGLYDELAAEFPAFADGVAHALTYCDMTTSRDGHSIDVEARLQEIFARYGDGDVVSESIKEAAPQIRRSTQIVTVSLRNLM